MSDAHSIMRRKPLADVVDEAADSGLFKSLGLWQLTAIGVGAIIGVGIFALAGQVAHGTDGAPGVGPAVMFSFLVAGLASAAAALSYSEFAGMIPRAGSAYTYGYVALGEIIGWFIGWDLLLEYTAVVAAVAIGISGYLNQLIAGIGIRLPDAITATVDQGGVINLPAMVLCLLIAFILSRGARTFGRFELVAVALKIALVLFVIILGAFYIKPANYVPFAPNGVGPVFSGSATVFFAVFGYDALSAAAEESRDGRRHMPKAILLSLGISMLLYVLSTLVLTGMQNWRHLDPEAAFAVAFQSVGLRSVAMIISACAVVSILTVMLAFMIGVTRVWFSMSRDGLLPGWFSRTDRRGVPQRVTWIAGFAAAFLAGVFPINEVADLTNIGILSAFVVVCTAVIIFHYRRPDAPRTFRLRAPWMPVVPAFGVLASFFLITQLQPVTWLRFVVWLVVGLVIYFTYGRRHSLLEPDSPRRPVRR